MFDQPYGSPLDPMRRRAPLGALGATQPLPVPAPLPPLPMAPPGLPGAPTGLMSPTLPTPPASIKRKSLNVWDKEHISGTLAEISKGLLSGGNIWQGLGAAGQNVAGRVTDLQKAQQGTSKIGGPDNAFRIMTDADGNETMEAIPEFVDYATAKRKRESAPKPKDTAELAGDMSYSIEQLDEAQRPGAYQMMRQQAADLGHNVDGWPPEYSPTFAKAAIGQTIGARQGSANEATRQYRETLDRDRDASRAISERNSNSTIANRAASNGRAAAAAGRAAASHRGRRTAPPSTRRRSTGDLDYLR